MVTRMSKKLKQKVLESLTNGNFTRAKRVLVNNEDTSRMCCLGVIMNEAARLGLLPPIPNEQIYARSNQMLTDEELRLLGITGDDQSKLVNYNDNDEVPEGMYYPKNVIDFVRGMRVIWDGFDEKAIGIIKELASLQVPTENEDLETLIELSAALVKQHEG